MRKALPKRCSIVAAIGTVATAACGGGSTTSPQATRTSTPAPKIAVKITSPEKDASVNARVKVRGLVTPEDATVDVNGEAASVQNGRFTAMVLLKKGDQRLRAT